MASPGLCLENNRRRKARAVDPCGSAETPEKRGAVGDINGHFFDSRGNQIASELDRHFLGLTIQEIKSLPLTVGVATGSGKYEAVKAALTGRLLKVLVTDLATARRLAAE